MSSDNGLVVEFGTTSILRIKDFSWVFLVDWIMLIFLTVFVLFYLPQLVGWGISQVLGWFLWHRYEIWFKIEGIQFSLLTARVLFKNVVYIGSNEAIHIVHGNLTWRFWIPSRRTAALLQERGHEQSKLPCTLSLEMHGLEWFVYNRSYAFDSLGSKPTEQVKINVEVGKRLSYMEQRLLGLAPMAIEIHKGSMIIGNAQTESVVMLSTNRVDATLDLDHASNARDRYMIKFLAQVHRVQVRLLANPDHELSPLAVPGAGLNDGVEISAGGKEKASKIQEDVTCNLGGHKSKFVPHWMKLYTSRRRPGAARTPWLGLRRYLGDRETDGDSEMGENNLSPFDVPAEYARVSVILETEVLDLEAMWDVVAPMPPGEADSSYSGETLNTERKASADAAHEQESTENARSKSSVNAEFAESSVGGVTADPIFRINLKLVEATINYGPWANRQQQQFSAAFMPRSCTDDKVPQPPQPGELVLLPGCTVFVELEGQTIIRVPTREASKDEFFLSRYRKSGGQAERSYGWLEISSQTGSTLLYTIPYYPRSSDGLQYLLQIDLRKPEIRTSVNHAAMLHSSKLSLRIDQHVPLKWNGLQTWMVNVDTRGVDLFLLREHLLLLSDTIGDFATGPPTPYELFTPLLLKIQWKVRPLALYLNVNKKNIIDDPTSLTENTYLVLRSDNVVMDWTVPMVDIASPMSFYQFRISSKLVEMDLSAPQWHTLHSFLDSPGVARVEDFVLTMDDNTTTTTTATPIGAPGSARNVNTSMINIHGRNFTLLSYGFVINYFMIVRENYFGHEYHFHTSEEYLEQMQDSASSSSENSVGSQKNNEEPQFTREDPDLDIHMHIFAENACFVFPAYLYSAREALAFHTNELSADCRFTNYYMHLQVNTAPLVGRVTRGLHFNEILDLATTPLLGERMLDVSYLDVRAHRMFGLPPSEPTYMCKWDFDYGDIVGDACTDFVELFNGIHSCFAHSYADVENQISAPPDAVYDVSFVSANISSFQFTLRPSRRHTSDSHVDHPDPNATANVKISMSTIKMRLNDLANERYTGRTTLNIPYVEVACFNDGQIVGKASFPVYITKFNTVPHSSEHFKRQQEHIALHDCLFHRTPFLLRDDVRQRPPYSTDWWKPTAENKAARGHPGSTIVTPSIPLPSLEPQLTREVVNLLHPLVGEFDLEFAQGRRFESSSSTSVSSGQTDMSHIGYRPFSLNYAFHPANASVSTNAVSPGNSFAHPRGSNAGQERPLSTMDTDESRIKTKASSQVSDPDISNSEANLSAPPMAFAGSSGDSQPPSAPWSDGDSSENEDVYGPPPAATSSATDSLYESLAESLDFAQEQLRETLHDKRADFDMHPTPWRADAPFLPADDDDFEYDSVAAQFGNVNVDLAPSAVAVIYAFLGERLFVNAEHTLDKLQIGVVEILREVQDRFSFSAHILLPLVRVRLGKLANEAGHPSLTRLVLEGDNVTLTCNSIDLMFHLNRTPVQKRANGGLHVEVESISLDVQKGKLASSLFGSGNAVSLLVSHVVAWVVEEKDEEMCGAFNFGDIDASVAADQLEWALSYLANIGTVISEISDCASQAAYTRSRNSGSMKQATALRSVFHALTMAGEKLGIEQDSYVLSRPSGTVLSENHVRSRFSWRIAVRLRDLLHQLPKSDVVKIEKDISEGLYELPANARQQCLEVFSRWRSWEHNNDVREARIFPCVFADRSFQSKVMRMVSRFILRSEGTVLRVSHGDLLEHFVRLDYLSVQLTAKKPSSDTHNVGIMVSCAKMSAQLGNELLELAGRIVDLLPTLENISISNASDASDASGKSYRPRPSRSETRDSAPHETESKVEPAPGEGSSEPPEEHISVNSNDPDEDSRKNSEMKPNRVALQVHVSFFVYDLSIVYRFFNIGIELQNHQIQSAIAVEHVREGAFHSLYHSGVLLSSNGGFRVYHVETSNDIVDYLLSSLTFGWAVRSPKPVGRYLLADADTLSLVVHYTLPQMAELIAEFVHTDVPTIRALATKLYQHRHSSHKNTKEPPSSSDAPLEESDKGASSMNFNLRIGSIKIKVGLLANTRFITVGERLVVDVRRPLVGTILIQTDLESLLLQAQYKTNRILAQGKVEQVQALLRNEQDLSAMEFMVKFSALRIETGSVIWLLEYMRRNSVPQQLEQFVNTSKTAIESSIIENRQAFDLERSHNPESTAAQGLKNVRLRLLVDKIEVVLPLDTHSFILGVEELRLKYENFDRFEKIKDMSSSYAVKGGSVTELNVVLRGPNDFVRKILKLHLSATFHNEHDENSLDLDSHFFRIESDPETVGAFFLATQKLRAYNYDAFKTTGSASQAETTRDKNELDGIIDDNTLHLLQRLKVKISLQNIAMTWFTDSRSHEGLEFGLQVLQIHMAQLVARMDVGDVYLTFAPLAPLAPKEKMINRTNAIVLPRLAISGSLLPLKEDPSRYFVNLNMVGESASIALTPLIAPWLANIISSFELAGETVSHLDRRPLRRHGSISFTPQSSKTDASSATSPPSPTIPTKPLTRSSSRPRSESFSNQFREGSQRNNLIRLPVSMHVEMHFEKALLKLFEDHEDVSNTRDYSASLDLHSPSLDFIGEYLRTHESGERDQVFVDLFISATNNSIYPKALQEIRSIIESVEMIMARRRSNVTDPSTPSRPNRPRRLSLSARQRPAIDLASSLLPQSHLDAGGANSIVEPGKCAGSEDLLAFHEVFFKLHLARQELYLGCQPFAKVGAKLSAESLDLHITTPSDGTKLYLAVQAQLRGARVSLQHMYSREISTSAAIGILTIAATHQREVNTPLQIVANINDPKIVLRLNQMHDFRTFVDIWRLFDQAGPADPAPEPSSWPLENDSYYRTASNENVQNATGGARQGEATSGAGTHRSNSNTTTSPDSEPSSSTRVPHTLSDQYRRVMTSVAIPWSLNVSILKFSSLISMGQSVGDNNTHIDRMWIAAFKSSTWESQIMLGIDNVAATSEGRLGGMFELENLQARLTVAWLRSSYVPLIQTTFCVDKIVFYISFDFHPFLTGRLRAAKFSMSNQRSETGSEAGVSDHLFSMIHCDEVYLAFTAIVASHLYDVARLFRRLQSQISNRLTLSSPEAQELSDNAHKGHAERREELLEWASLAHSRRTHSREWRGEQDDIDEQAAEEDDSDAMSQNRSRSRHRSMRATPGDSASSESSEGGDDDDSSGIRVVFDIRLGEASVHVFPTEFSDPIALKIAVAGLGMHYWRHLEAGISRDAALLRSSIKLQMRSCLLALSTIRGGGYKRAMTELDVNDFLTFVRKSAPSGGTIVNMPELDIDMDSREFKDTVHFTFSNKFGGLVDVGWNLGAVNFIREMGDAHKQAWKARQTFDDPAKVAAATMSTDKKDEPSVEKPEDKGDVNTIVETKVDDLGPVVVGGIRYIPDGDPEIIIPQLRDMGEATPPIEWLGVNRQRLPGFLHYYLVRNLGRTASDVELLYGELLEHIGG